MALFKYVVEAYVASRELDTASLSRLAFWTDALGDREVAQITTEDIDTALLTHVAIYVYYVYYTYIPANFRTL